MQNKYKVQFEQITNYVVDVLAENETEATEKAIKKLEEAKTLNMEHYLIDSDPITNVSNIFDVTNTDDPFNP